MKHHDYRIRALAACAIVSLLLVACVAGEALAAKNVILMIGDGMGYQHVRAGGYYLNGSAGTLCFEPFHRAGVKTRSLNSSVTDSAAAGTALATGYKVNNGAISQSATGQPYLTILEEAKALGKKTGLVTTVPITHATPAAFGAHEASRNSYINIGNDFLNSSRPDVLFGGGGTASGGSSYFSTTQINTAKALGYQAVYDATQMLALDPATTTRALGLFSSGYLTMEYDRQPSNTQPHLSQMTAKALELVETDADGFFLMVEGGQIDTAAHSNNIYQTTREVVEFHNSVQTVLNWLQGRNDTMLIVTADHETGGLTAINRGAGIYPSATWSTGDHTGANVPFYVTGANASLVDQYILNGAVDNTDVYRIMSEAYVTPVPEPSGLLALASGLGSSVVLLKRRRTAARN